MFGSACGSKSNFERIPLFPIVPLKFQMDKGVIFSTSMCLGVSFTRLTLPSTIQKRHEMIRHMVYLLMVHDLYYMAIIKLYYNMMNGHLPDDFNLFKPHTSISCTRYPIRYPIMQYPFIKHEYALSYQLIRVINRNTDCFSFSNQLNNSIPEKATTLSFYGYKVYAKNMILASYREACNIVDCYTCNNL